MYVAVNRDGSEVCSNGTLFRYSVALSDLIERDERYKMYQEREDKWCNTYSEGYFTVPRFEGVTLPNGSIKRLLGIEMTWTDNPIKIDSLTEN